MKIRDLLGLKPFDREEFARNPLRCYGCGEQHTSTEIGNRAGQPDCLGFIRGEDDAMRVFCGAINRMGTGKTATMIAPGVAVIEQKKGS